jgi:hypothetical protein
LDFLGHGFTAVDKEDRAWQMNTTNVLCFSFKETPKDKHFTFKKYVPNL